MDALISHNLRAQKTEGFFLKQDLHGHDSGAGIIAGMAGGRKIYLVAVDTGFSGRAFIDTGAGSCHVKKLNDGGT